VIVETVGQFVNRTRGPLVPYVEACYPWAYAHHYLRAESGTLPKQLGATPVHLTLREATELIHLWCAMSGESVETSARSLADAYLERWGVPRPQRAPAAAVPGPREGAPQEASGGSGAVGAAAAPGEPARELAVQQVAREVARPPTGKPGRPKNNRMVQVRGVAQVHGGPPANVHPAATPPAGQHAEQRRHPNQQLAQQASHQPGQQAGRPVEEPVPVAEAAVD
jgi:hypothetical protein